MARREQHSLIIELIVAVRRDQSARNDRAILIPEQDTEWPPGYDFAALEEADSEEEAARTALEELLTKLEQEYAEVLKSRGGHAT